MLAGQIQPQAQSSTRPATSAKLLHRTEPGSPQCRNCKLPGRRQAWIQRAQSKSPVSRPGQVPPGPHKAAICVGRPQGEGIRCPAHPGALGLVHVVPTHSKIRTYSPGDPPRRSRPEPASPWGSRSQTDEIPAKTPAFNEGGATEKPAPRGALARSLRDPSELLKFSRESSSPGLRKAICIFTSYFFFPPFGSFNWYFGPERGTSLEKETG